MLFIEPHKNRSSNRLNERLHKFPRDCVVERTGPKLFSVEKRLHFVLQVEVVLVARHLAVGFDLNDLLVVLALDVVDASRLRGKHVVPADVADVRLDFGERNISSLGDSIVRHGGHGFGVVGKTARDVTIEA